MIDDAICDAGSLRPSHSDEDEDGNPPDPRVVQAFRDRKDDSEAVPGEEPICEYFRRHFEELPD